MNERVAVVLLVAVHVTTADQYIIHFPIHNATRETLCDREEMMEKETLSAITKYHFFWTTHHRWPVTVRN